MSSFLMGYSHHMQNPMGGSSIDPKFPPSEEFNYHHNGYTSITQNLNQNTMDYMQHQTNGIHTTNPSTNYNYHHQSIGGHFYHHHHGYSSQMSSIPNNNYTSNGYYGSYYGTNNGHHNQTMDLPIQCPNTEPTNTVLGLQELGNTTQSIANYT